MKTFFLSLFILAAFQVSAQSNGEIKPAEKGVVYGKVSPKGTSITVNELAAKEGNGLFEGKVTGKVKEVCKAMGCWIKLEKEDGSTLLVKSKDHGFFMPDNLVGKKVVVEGVASLKEESEEMRKHYAKDAGKSKEEIDRIKGASKEVQFIAKGVQVLD